MDIALIKKRLLEDGYKDNETTENTARRLFSLTGKSSEMLQDWVKNDITPSFEAINGVGSDWLIKKLKMKAPALAIAYAMLIENPDENVEYFKHLADNIISFYPN